MRMKVPKEAVQLELVDRTQSTQVRVNCSEEAVDAYREVLVDGGDLAAIDLFYDRERNLFFVGDGWHRLFAYDREGREEIPAFVYPGGEREAFLHALGANSKHGLPRTTADKRRAVELALQDAEIATWSSRQIALQCSVSNHFVDKVRADVAVLDPLGGSEDSTGNIPSRHTRRTGKDGVSRRLPKKKAGSKEKPADTPAPVPEPATEPPADEAVDEAAGFDPTALPRKLKNGVEKITAKERREAKASFGRFVRYVGKVGLDEKLDEPIQLIATEMKKHWGGYDLRS